MVLVIFSSVLNNLKVLEEVKAIFFSFCQNFSNFVRIDTPMYFLEVATPKTRPRYAKNRIFTDFSKITIFAWLLYPNFDFCTKIEIKKLDSWFLDKKIGFGGKQKSATKVIILIVSVFILLKTYFNFRNCKTVSVLLP